MGRRRFDHWMVELSVALGVRVPRYALWLFVHDCGLDPESLGKEDVAALCDDHLDRFLADRGEVLGARARRRLSRRCQRFDPRRPTPEEFMQRLGGDSV
ncbi:MAG: hypothetical protein ACQGVK_10590 [Myxococcota bacterium]